MERPLEGAVVGGAGAGVVVAGAIVAGDVVAGGVVVAGLVAAVVAGAVVATVVAGARVVEGGVVPPPMGGWVNGDVEGGVVIVGAKVGKAAEVGGAVGLVVGAAVPTVFLDSPWRATATAIPAASRPTMNTVSPMPRSRLSCSHLARVVPARGRSIQGMPPSAAIRGCSGASGAGDGNCLRPPLTVIPPRYREPVLRRCGRCGQWKALDDFAWRRRLKAQRDNYCRPCRSDYKKEHYAANKARYIAKPSATYAVRTAIAAAPQWTAAGPVRV